MTKKKQPIVAHDAVIVEETHHSGQEVKVMTLQDVILKMDELEKRLNLHEHFIQEIKKQLSENDLDFANLFKQFHFLSERSKFDNPVAEVVPVDSVTSDPAEDFKTAH